MTDTQLIEITYFEEDISAGAKRIRMKGKVPHCIADNPFDLLSEYDKLHGTNIRSKAVCVFDVKAVVE